MGARQNDHHCMGPDSSRRSASGLATDETRAPHIRRVEPVVHNNLKLISRVVRWSVGREADARHPRLIISVTSMSYPAQLRLSGIVWLGYAATCLVVVGVLAASRPALHADDASVANVTSSVLVSAVLAVVLSRLRWPLERSKLDAAQPVRRQRLQSQGRSWGRIVSLGIVGVAVVCFLGVSAIRKDYATPRLVADLFILFGTVWLDTARRVQVVENIRHSNYFELRRQGDASVFSRRLVRMPGNER